MIGGKQSPVSIHGEVQAREYWALTVWIAAERYPGSSLRTPATSHAHVSAWDWQINLDFLPVVIITLGAEDGRYLEVENRMTIRKHVWDQVICLAKLITMEDLPADAPATEVGDIVSCRHSSNMSTTISSLLIVCLRQFNNLVTSGRLRQYQSEVPHELWQDELGRLRVWAADIGAHQVGQSSLDYRLRDASNIRDQTIRLLETLQRAFEDLEQVLSEPEPELASDDDHTESDDERTEIQQIYDGLADTIKCLYQISMVIRRPAQHDRLLGTERVDAAVFEPYDRQHVENQYPRAERTIIDRLGVAISRRRADLKYRERHNASLVEALTVYSMMSLMSCQQICPIPLQQSLSSNSTLNLMKLLQIQMFLRPPMHKPCSNAVTGLLFRLYQKRLRMETNSSARIVSSSSLSGTSANGLVIFSMSSRHTYVYFPIAQHQACSMPAAENGTITCRPSTRYGPTWRQRLIAPYVARASQELAFRGISGAI